jgi:hypothetical protein
MMFNKPSGPGFGGRGFGNPIPRNQPTAPFSSPSTPAPTGANGIAGAFQGVNPARAGYDVGTAAVMANQRPSQVPMQSVMSGWGSQDQAPAQYMRGMMDGLRGQPPVYGGSQQNYDPYAGGQGYNPFASYNQNAQPIGFADGGVTSDGSSTSDEPRPPMTTGVSGIPASVMATRDPASTTGGTTVARLASAYGDLSGNKSNYSAIAQTLQDEATRNQVAANYNAMMNNPVFIDSKAKVASGDIVNTPYGYMSLEEATRRGINPDQIAESERLYQINRARTLAELDASNAAWEAQRAATPIVRDPEDYGVRETMAPPPARTNTIAPPPKHTSHFAPRPTPVPATSAPPSVAATPSSEPQGAQGFNNFMGFQNLRDNLRNRLQTYQPRPAATPSRPQAGAFGGFGNAAGGGRPPVSGGIFGGRR